MTGTEPATRPGRGRRWPRILGIIALGGFLFTLGFFIYINTDSFQALVRRRLVAEVERVTGGRVEIGSIHTIPFLLQADVRGITVHGSEAATDVPLAHVERFVARLKISSLLGSELSFHEVILEEPVLHVAFSPNGATNIPARADTAIGGIPLERLFALSIDRIEFRGGQLLWDNQSIPLDLAARNIFLQMDYSFLHRRYDGRLLLGAVETKLLDCRPFAWMTTLEFSLSSNSAIIPSLKWNSGHSHFSAKGEVNDLRHPQMQGDYEALVDLGEAASIARRHDLQGGMLELKGEGSWSLDEFSSNGLLTLRDLGWRDDQIAFSRTSLTTGYSVTDQQLKLSKLQARIFGGGITGDVELDQWLAPKQHLSNTARKVIETATISAARPLKKNTEKAPKTKPQTIQNAFLSLHLRDLSVEELAAALNNPAHRLSGVRPTGFSSGTIQARWKGTPQDAEVQFALDVAPPAQHVAGEMPIAAHASGSYYAATQAIDLAQFGLTTPTSRIQASGKLSADSALRFSVHTSSLADWLPFLEAARGPSLIPVTLNGSATFNGSMSGSLSLPELSGNVQADDFDINIPGTAKTHPLQMHWDSLATFLQLSFNSIVFHNAILKRDDTSAHFDASAHLDHGHLTGDSMVTLRANANNVDLAALQALLGYDYPISGNTDFFLQAAGSFSNLHGDGQVHLSHAMAYGQTIRQFDSNFRIGQGEIAFSSLHLWHDSSIVTGNADYNPSSRGFRLDLTGSNFALSQVQQLQFPRLTTDGQADFILKASGTTAALTLDASVHLRNLAVNHEIAGELDLHAVTQGDELHLTGNSNFQQGSLAIKGNVRLRDDEITNITFQMDQLGLDSLWHTSLHGVTGHSAVTGTVDLHGPARHPERWTLGGTLTALALDIENAKVHNQDPVRFSLASQSVNIQQLHLVGEGTDLSIHGAIQLAGSRTLDLAAAGGLDLKLLTGVYPDLTSSGLVTMNMTVGGTLSDPLPQGHFQVTSGAISYAGLPSGLTDLTGSLLFSRDHMRIETLSARTGGGVLDLKGDATYFNRQLNFNVTAASKDVRLRYPPGVSSTADAELHWIGTRFASTVSGDIRVNKMAVTPGFDFGAYLERSRQFSTVTGANSPLNNIKLDIHVVTAPELQMRTAIARLSGDADLHLRGSVGRPAVLGRMDILEGQATFHGTRYTLERGDITFTNPVAIEPQLNLQAFTHVRSYDLSITLTGTPDHGLNLNYRSEPPLPKSDIIALLALGRTNGESAQLQEQSGQSAFSDQASALILSQALNGTVSNRMERLFGASNIKIDPQGLSSETNPLSTGPQITIEQQFANNLSLTYSTNVSQSSQQIIQGEYYFNRNVSAVGTRDQNGVVSFDLRIRRRKK